MKIDLLGRVRNIKLPNAKALLPLFEAVVNSIHSIDDRRINDGYIKILICRDNHQPSLINGASFSPIDGFKVIDNGVGFNSENYESFLTSDTSFKISRGSKGVGRFLWLKAFSKIKIDSIYQKSNAYFRRSFNFTTVGDGIADLTLEKLDSQVNSPQTIIELSGFQKPYKDNCPQDYDLIGRRILEHCISYFFMGNTPSIQVIDGEYVFDLNDYGDRHLESFAEEVVFNVNNYKFLLKSLRFYGSDSSEHKISYCANNREVSSENLSKYIPDLISGRKIRDADNKAFTYLAYVSGEYLDNCVNSERTDFNIREQHLELTRQLEEISMEEIRTQLISTINHSLSPFLSKIREKKNQQISNYITQEAPQYRPVLKYLPEKLAQIQPGLPINKLDIELHKLLFNYEISLKEKEDHIMNLSIENFDQYPEYQRLYSEFLEKYNDLGESRLAHYIVHRKIILKLFERKLSRDENGRYSLEKDVHEIIFPLKRTSDNITFESQNLWIVDERLSYHSYLASDQPLNKLENISIESSDRPDLLIFNNPIAFFEGEEQPYSSIVVIEFKRPMRDSYTDSDNPISQVYSYIRKIKSGNFTDRNGRLVTLQESTPFYAYIICDITAKIRDFAEDGSLLRTPDLQGYFGYNSPLNTYVEIFSFEKLISDAKKRNNILFKKLGLP